MQLICYKNEYQKLLSGGGVYFMLVAGIKLA
jgi:hypothetical protein